MKHAEVNIFSIAAERTAMERLLATKLGEYDLEISNSQNDIY